MSGPVGPLGTAWLEGLKASLAYQQAHGLPYKVNLIAKDDGSDPGTAVTMAKSLIAQKVLAILGLDASNLAVAVAKLATPSRTPVIGTAVLPPTDEYTYIAGLNPRQTFADEAPLIKALAAKLGKPEVRLAVAASDTASGHISVDPLVKELQGTNITMAGTQFVPSSVVNFDTNAANIANAKPDIVAVTNTNTSMLTIVKSLRSAGFTGPIVNYWAGAGEQMLQTLNDPQVYVYRDFADPSEDAAANMRSQAASVGGPDPTSFVAGNYYTEGYTMGLLVASVLKACGANCNAVKFNDALQTSASSVDTGGLTQGTVGFTKSDHTFLHSVMNWGYDPASKKQISFAPLPTAPAV